MAIVDQASSTARPTPADRVPRRARREVDEGSLLRRAAAVTGLLGIALVHVLDAPGKFHETPYLGWGYVLLIVGCVAVSGLLLERDDRRAWVAAVVLAVAGFAAYALSRTTGLPQARDDVGNWFEPLGLATLFAEVLVALIAVRSLVEGAER